MTEDDYSDLLNFERSDRYDERQKAALLYTSALVWNPESVDEELWGRLREDRQRRTWAAPQPRS